MNEIARSLVLLVGVAPPSYSEAFPRDGTAEAHGRHCRPPGTLCGSSPRETALIDSFVARLIRGEFLSARY
jgi:hypothetical protein